MYTLQQRETTLEAGIGEMVRLFANVIQMNKDDYEKSK